MKKIMGAARIITRAMLARGEAPPGMIQVSATRFVDAAIAKREGLTPWKGAGAGSPAGCSHGPARSSTATTKASPPAVSAPTAAQVDMIAREAKASLIARQWTAWRKHHCPIPMHQMEGILGKAPTFSAVGADTLAKLDGGLVAEIRSGAEAQLRRAQYSNVRSTACQAPSQLIEQILGL